MKYAVIKTGGKQYKVSEGDVIEVERIAALVPASTYTFEEVLLYVADGEPKVGAPMLSGIAVKGEVVDHIRGEKIRVSKYKAKVRYRRVTGHRQALTKIKILEISTKGSKKEEAEAPQKASKKAKKEEK